MDSRMDRAFTPPGPGAWELDTAHFARPLTPVTTEAALGGFARGFAESTKRFGLLLSHLEPAVQHGFCYMQPRAVGAPPGAGPPPKLLFKLLTRLHPELRRRIATSQAAFRDRLWREDLRLWDEEVKPDSIRRHRTMAATDVAALDDDSLVRHLDACCREYSEMVRQHHRFTITAALPVGDFLAHAAEWTGEPSSALLQLLAGSSPISRGVAARELGDLCVAIRESEPARRALEGADPAQVLAALRAMDGPVGALTTAYVETVGVRSMGYDVADTTAGELPGTLVQAIRAAVAGACRQDEREEVALRERTARIRDKVPVAHRPTFDALLTEARDINRLRDERGVYSDAPAVGLARRALLEVGRRLVDRGRLPRRELIIDASFDEAVALLRGQGGPTVAELSERERWRRTAGPNDAPKLLGGEPAPPPPDEWLPPAARRSARAIGAFMAALFQEPEPRVAGRRISGLPVSPGTFEGTARLVVESGDFGRIQRGDVLVTRSTSPYFNVVLPLLGAIVTDRGGQLCHAAIVAREYGIPGVVGTRAATQQVPDGARLRVDGSAGLVEVLA